MSAPRASGGKKRKRNYDDTPGQDESPVADAALSAFAELVGKRAEVFAGMPGGGNVADEALSIVKTLFDQCVLAWLSYAHPCGSRPVFTALTAEAGFLEQAGQLLTQLTDFGVQTRAKSRRRRNKAKEPATENPLLLPTPLVELVTADMPDEQVRRLLSSLLFSFLAALFLRSGNNSICAPASFKAWFLPSCRAAKRQLRL
jgi:hypothetical protein